MVFQSIFNRPGITPSIPTIIEQSFAHSQAQRLQDIKRRWDCYHGNFPKPLASDPTRADDNVIINLIRVCVEKSVSFMFSGVDFEIEGQDQVDKSDEDRYLDDVWQKNKKDIFLNQLGVNGAVTGHVFVKIKKDPRDNLPRLINLDPGNVYAIWDLEDYQSPVEFRIEWSGIDALRGRAIARRQIITRISEQVWEIYDEINHGNKWERLNTEKWLYSFPPIFHCQNLPCPNEFYGEPDVSDDIIHINNRINFVASNIARILRFHAHPKTWGRGITARDLDMSVDSLIMINTPDGVLQNLEMQSDLSSSIEFYKILINSLHEIMRIPDVAIGRSDNLGDLSGIALRLMFAPLLEKTQTKRLLYGDMLKSINDSLFVIAGRENVSTIVNWRNPLPTDIKDMLMLKQIGVSNKTILNQLGYDAETELAQRQAEHEQQLSAERSLGEIALRAFDRGDL